MDVPAGLGARDGTADLVSPEELLTPPLPACSKSAKEPELPDGAANPANPPTVEDDEAPAKLPKPEPELTATGWRAAGFLMTAGAPNPVLPNTGFVPAELEPASSFLGVDTGVVESCEVEEGGAAGGGGAQLPKAPVPGRIALDFGCDAVAKDEPPNDVEPKVEVGWVVDPPTADDRVAPNPKPEAPVDATAPNPDPAAGAPKLAGDAAKAPNPDLPNAGAAGASVLGALIEDGADAKLD